MWHSLDLHLLLSSLSPSTSSSLPPITQYWFLESHWSCQYRCNKDEVEVLVSHSVCVDVVCVDVRVHVCGMYVFVYVQS